MVFYGTGTRIFVWFSTAFLKCCLDWDMFFSLGPYYDGSFKAFFCLCSMCFFDVFKQYIPLCIPQVCLD